MPVSALSASLPPAAEGMRLDHALILLCPALGLRARRRLCAEGRALINGRPAPAGLKVRAGQQLTILPEPAGAGLIRDTADSAGGAGAAPACVRADALSGVPSSLSANLPADAAVECAAGASLAGLSSSVILPAAASLRPRLAARSALLAALDKPAGLPSARLAGSCRLTLEDWLPRLLPASWPGFPLLLNRLDTETSGLVLAALSPEGRAVWRAAEDAGRVDKRYLAVLEGVLPEGAELLLDAALDTDSRRVTRLLAKPGPVLRQTRVIGLAALPERNGLPRTLAGCAIRKGARHQIRAHLAGAGLPLAGDTQYGARLPGGFLLHHALCRVGDFMARALPPWQLPPDALERAAAWLERYPLPGQACRHP